MSSKIRDGKHSNFQEKLKESFMTKQTLKNLALALALLVLALIPSTSLGQLGLVSKLPAKRPASAAAQAASHQTKTPGSPSYTHTLLSFPGTLYTYANGINKGATSSKIEIVGGYGAADGGAAAGFLAHVSGKKAVTETYRAVNYPHVPPQQDANDVNDAGQIVGGYVDSSGVGHGYERSGGKFTTIDVPFAGATGTGADAINNSGEIVGGWTDSGGATHAFTLIGGTFTSFDYPGATFTTTLDVNNKGEIVGFYNDTNGVGHGFLLSGGTYTSIDVPGAVYTSSSGINDAGDIVGSDCTTSQCLSTNEGGQGFLLSGGVFTTITIPGEYYTYLIDINNNGMLLGEYQDAAGLVVSFLATP
jgi:probable HAF family extracellular repeat protein